MMSKQRDVETQIHRINPQELLREKLTPLPTTVPRVGLERSTQPEEHRVAASPAATSEYSIAGESPELLGSLVSLVANVTEAYTAAIFLADHSRQMLTLAASHTLSRDFIPEVTIPFGSGLVGWTAQNGVRISVCPFEHDATTLQYYRCDQNLKSFIAVPILNAQKEVLGVISCDSKKSYAFPKLTEKVLLDCAKQAEQLLGLQTKVGASEVTRTKPDESLLETLKSEIRAFNDEDDLLSRAANLPSELIQRDALVVLTKAECGVGSATFYSSSAEEQVGNRLLDLVCKHKKVICSERSVHALSIDDSKQRSFLSVPFHILNAEAGSLNLLSKPKAAFSAAEIAAVEEIAGAIGRELERIRLRDRYLRSGEEGGMLTWKQFSIKVKSYLEASKANNTQASLHRISFDTLHEIELAYGLEILETVALRIYRLASQISQPQGLACWVLNGQVFFFSDASESQKILQRFRRLIERLGTDDSLSSPRSSSSATVGAILSRGLRATSAEFPGEGASLLSLVTKTRSPLTIAEDFTQRKVAHAGHR